MKKDLKKQILAQAIESFYKVGYEKTTIRGIARNLGIAVGNVTYYYPKKENLVHDFHNLVMNSFLPEIMEKEPEEKNWTKYFLTEYSFIHFIAFDEKTASLYASFINVPSLRRFYIEKHQELFLSFFPERTFEEKRSFASTTGMCYLEFALVTELRNRNDFHFDEAMEEIFEARLIFLGLNPAAYRGNIKKAVSLAKDSLPELQMPHFSEIFR